MSCDKFKSNDEEKLFLKKIIQFLIYAIYYSFKGN